MGFDFSDILKAINREARAAGQQLKTTKEKAQWVWEALQGDFNPNRSMGQVGLDMGVCLIPGVDTVMDFRDLIANIIAIVRTPTSGFAWFSLILTLIGFIPELGSVAKGVVKLVLIKLRPLLRQVDDLTNTGKVLKAVDQAFDEALPLIMDYLRDRRVQEFLTKVRLPDIVKKVATTIRSSAALVNPAYLKALFGDRANELKDILEEVGRFMPQSAAQRIGQVGDGILTIHREFNRRVDQLVAPAKAIMERIAQRLDEMYWLAYSQQVNRGWIAPLSEQGARRLIAKHKPKWMKTGGQPEYPQFQPTDFRKATNFEAAKAAGAPDLNPDEMLSFANIAGRPVRSRALRDGERLYRIVDPTSGTWSSCWVTEDVWKQINSSPDPRATWRSKLAVKPEWNQNGQYITYTHNRARDGEVVVWDGPTAMQPLSGDDYLEGGFSQIVMHPWKSIRDMKQDNFVNDISMPDMVEGGTLARPGRIRVSPTDTRINGPHLTNWGFRDFEDQHDLIGLPNPNR